MVISLLYKGHASTHPLRWFSEPYGGEVALRKCCHLLCHCFCCMLWTDWGERVEGRSISCRGGIYVEETKKGMGNCSILVKMKPLRHKMSFWLHHTYLQSKKHITWQCCSRAVQKVERIPLCLSTWVGRFFFLLRLRSYWTKTTSFLLSFFFHRGQKRVVKH